MHKRIAIGWMSLVLILSACKSDKDTTTTTAFGKIPAALIDTLKTIGQPVQQIEIDPSKDNVVKGSNGTVLFIAAKSLVNEEGAPITSDIVIELKEQYTFADFITSNLQTVHNDDILQTQGMIYFDAHTKDGGVVKIDPARPVRIEFPVNEKLADTKIFSGHRDAYGNMNWDELVEPEKLLIPFPIATLFQIRSECEFIFLRTITLETERNVMSVNINYTSKYENTLIATREFRQRFMAGCDTMISKIYMENIDKNLWEIDELVVSHFINDSIKLTALRPKAKRSQQYEIDHALDHDRKIILAFQKFAAEKLTKVDRTRSVSESAIDRAIDDAIKADAARYAQAREDDYVNFGFDSTSIETRRTAFLSYSAKSFGWVNVDYFYNDPTAEKIKVSVITDRPAAIVDLIIPGKKIVLSGYSDDQRTYVFTKMDDGYNKLPKGQKAFFICIGMEGDKLFFAKREIILGQREEETLDVEPTTADALKQHLQKIE